jgi:hypothetical protein
MRQNEPAPLLFRRELAPTREVGAREVGTYASFKKLIAWRVFIIKLFFSDVKTL